MEGTLKFNIPEEEIEFRMAIDSPKYFNSLWEMDRWLRSEIKHNDSLNEVQYDTFEQVRNKLHDIMSDNDIRFN